MLWRSTLPVDLPPRDLAQPHELHRTVMRAFPDALPRDLEEGRVLWRLEHTAQSQSLIQVSSRLFPDWDALRVGWWAPPRVVRFDPLVPVGSPWRFRLRANPVGRRASAIVDPIRWIADQASEGGFRLRECLVIDEGIVLIRKPQTRPLPLVGVRFEGKLVVEEPTRFAERLRIGMGHGKAWGFGLLTIDE